MIKILYVDDEIRLCKAWEKLFAMQADFELLGTSCRTEAVGGLVQQMGPDILLIDLTMPGDDPLGTIRRMAAEHPGTRSVVYTGRSDMESVRAACDAGAWGYIDKLAEPEEMFTVLRRVAAGETVFPALWGDLGL